MLGIAAIRDITERREIQRKLEASEERFRLTVDYAPIGIALVSPTGDFLRVNRKLCDMTGYAEGELLSKKLQDITFSDDLNENLELMRQVLGGELDGYEMETRYYRSDGSLLWILLSVSLVRADGGTPMHFVAQIQDVTDRRHHEDELRCLAEHDVLTGMKNRRALSHELARQLSDQARYGHEFALLMVDLDHFKYVNDTLGHGAGDQVIRAVADALSARLRVTDTLARLGGHEFAIMLPNSSRASAQLLATELLTTIAGLRVDAADREVQVSASIGIVVVDELGEFDENSLLAAADLAMYEAKEAGRDRYAFHDSKNGNQVRATERLNWSHRIRQALHDDLFVLHYQPIIKLADPSQRRYEALIRMADQPGEPIEPGVFLYIADRYGLMPAIDRWVIRRVITSLASGRLPDGASVAVNVSARSLTDSGLVALVERLIGEYRIDPHRLSFEVTETAAISKMDEAKLFGRRLQRLGCGFALDDFGTGFGSFYQLKHLPYDTIKIDGDFIHGIATNPEDQLLVEALVRVAKGTHKKTVAEFVGDEATVRLLQELGVDYWQGYHLGRPVPAEQLPH
ncbi:MAG: putative bifunctional diguanylate cyclase/phosphodiesterase [Solirubrobacteraceae bacterium]